MDGNFEYEFYTFIRPNQEQLRKMQLYIGPLAGIEPAVYVVKQQLKLCNYVHSTCNVELKPSTFRVSVQS